VSPTTPSRVQGGHRDTGISASWSSRPSFPIRGPENFNGTLTVNDVRPATRSGDAFLVRRVYERAWAASASASAFGRGADPVSPMTVETPVRSHRRFGNLYEGITTVVRRVVSTPPLDVTKIR